MLWGGVGFVENMDMADCEGAYELESLYHGLVDSDAVLRANSLVSFSCFDWGAVFVCVWDGPVRFRLLLLGRRCCGFVGRLGDGGLEESADESEVKAICSFEDLCISAQPVETRLFHRIKGTVP